MFISSQFDSGNITVIEADDPGHIRLEITPDNNSHYYQWFHFRVASARDQALSFDIENAGGAAYLGGWKDYRVCYSYDRETWYRTGTRYDGKLLSWDFKPSSDVIWFAYFAPYSHERHQDLIAHYAAMPNVKLIVPGKTLDGRTMDVLRIGEPSDTKRTIWVTARQHPGETMAEWWMEGFLADLLDTPSEAGKDLLENACIYAVPCMNPDGAARGHLRTNAAGVDLNREWMDPSLEKSPEVYLIRQMMDETGSDLCMDAHGDETIPNNFIAGAEGIPNWDERHANLLAKYKQELVKQSPDFQTQEGYPPSPPGKANLKIGANYMAYAYDCLGMTLEMPFKDTRATPDADHGWSPERCRVLGKANVAVMAEIVGDLR